MAVTMDIVYQGSLRTQATHGPSGTSITTDAPTDNGGQGAAFSPTDLIGVALGTCIVTTMGIVAQRNNLDLTGTTVHVVKNMVAQPVRRIGTLGVTVTVPADKAAKLSVEDRQRLERAGLHCPVHHSLHPDVNTPVEFVYEK